MTTFPMTEVGGVSLSRLIVGTNWFLCYSHTSKAKDRFIKRYQTRENIADILTVFMDAGINAVMGMPEPILCDAIREAQDRTGRDAKLIVSPHFNILPGGPPDGCSVTPGPAELSSSRTWTVQASGWADIVTTL